jgi:hypothetical protein
MVYCPNYASFKLHRDLLKGLKDEESYARKFWMISITWGKGKYEVVPVLNQVPRQEDVWGCGGMAPRINLGTRWRCVVNAKPPAALP